MTDRLVANNPFNCVSVMMSDDKKTSPKNVAKRMAERKLKGEAKGGMEGKKAKPSIKKPKSPSADWYQAAKARISISSRSSDR